MKCGKFKNSICYYDVGDKHLYVDTATIIFPKDRANGFVPTLSNSEDDERFEAVSKREDFLGYLATESGLLYFDKSSMMFSLIGREEEPNPAFPYLTSTVRILWDFFDSKANTSVTGIKPVGYHITGKSLRPIMFVQEEKIFMYQGEALDIQVPGLPINFGEAKTLELFQHFVRLGCRPKEMITTTAGVFVRPIGCSTFERSL